MYVGRASESRSVSLSHSFDGTPLMGPGDLPRLRLVRLLTTDSANRKLGVLLLGGLTCVVVLVGTALIAWRWLAPVPGVPPETPTVPATAATPIPQASPADFVGDAACAQCHAEIVEQYASHPMSRSMAKAGEPATLATFDKSVQIKPGGRCVYFVRQAGEDVLEHHESMSDAKGEVIYDQAVTMDYAMGSGEHGRSYLSNHHGVLLMSSISWYANGNRWELSPGYVADDQRRFGRRILDECLACHCGRVTRSDTASSVYAQKPFAQLSIGCENCHGPGRQHIAARQDSSAAASDPIINPARLAPAHRDSVCNQCHLQAAARIPRYGRTFFDFQPGQRLEEVITVFLTGSPIDTEGKAKSVSHVQQMMDSQCYRNSDGELGCISCHDPHGVPAAESRADFYRDKCFACHENESCAMELDKRLKHESKNSCFECHMPQVGLSDVAHTAQTDHRVLARPAAATDKTAPPTDRLLFFDDANQRMPQWEANRASGLAIVEHLSVQGQTPSFPMVEQLLAPGLEFAPDDVRVMVVLTDVALKSGNLEATAKYAAMALEHDPNCEAALVALELIAYQNGNLELGLGLANHLNQINPMNVTLYAHRADMLRLSSRLDEAIEVARQGIELNPRMLPLRRWLSNAYREVGKIAESDEQLSIISRIENAPAVK